MVVQAYVWTSAARGPVCWNVCAGMQGVCQVTLSWQPVVQ